MELPDPPMTLNEAVLSGTPAAPSPMAFSCALEVPPTRKNYLRLAAEVEKSLQDDVLTKFFPGTVDLQGGGFFENFSANWTHVSPPNLRGPVNVSFQATPFSPTAPRPVFDSVRSVVYQARLTWLASHAAMRYPDQAVTYLKIAGHGASFLQTKQWDAKQGGFWFTVDSTGRPLRDSKHVYGNAFGIFALAAYFQASHDARALQSAHKALAWLEAQAFDVTHGGYYEQIRGDNSRQSEGIRDLVGVPVGHKSMNSHIHLLEAFTALLQVWPDALLQKRTEALYQLCLEKIYTPPGYLRQFFTPDWAPDVMDPATADSYGHDMESAYLFGKAAAALGKPDDPQCWQVSRNIVNHCLKVGFDSANGGLNTHGSVDGTTPPHRAKVWWIQAESLNTLLLMHDRLGNATAIYWETFVKQWAFICQHQIDSRNGGWYPTLDADNHPLPRNKTDAWTDGYHQGRALLAVVDMLKTMAQEMEA